MASNVLSFPVPGSSGIVGPVAASATNTVTYYGYALRETGGTAGAVIRIHAGSAAGTILDTISIATSGQAAVSYLPQGLQAVGGVYVERVSGAGTIEGSIRVG